MTATAAEQIRPAGVGPGAAYDSGAGRWVEGDFWFDEAAADKAVAFFADYLCFTKGEWAGRPFLLEAGQSDRIVHDSESPRRQPLEFLISTAVGFWAEHIRYRHTKTRKGALDQFVKVPADFGDPSPV